MKIPTALAPDATMPFEVEASGVIAVAKATPRFTAWGGPPPEDTYRGKQVLDHEGRPAFAELVILWTLQAAGWDGVWIDSFAGAFRRGYWGCPVIPELPPGPAAMLRRIQVAAGSRFGAWDVFCWSGDAVLFVESKRARRDRIRQSQVNWLRAGLASGLPVGSFLVVEWSLSGATARRQADTPAGGGVVNP